MIRLNNNNNNLKHHDYVNLTILKFKTLTNTNVSNEKLKKKKIQK